MKTFVNTSVVRWGACSFLWRPRPLAVGMALVVLAMVLGGRLNEALAFSRGTQTGTMIHEVEVPSGEAASIGANTELSQGTLPLSIRSMP